MDPAADTSVRPVGDRAPAGSSSSSGGGAAGSLASADRLGRLGIWLAVAAGIGVRFWLWWQDRPFWRDEAGLLQSLDAYGLRALLGPLADAQSAPPGWLLAERLTTTVLGDGERVYRLLPFLAGCATLVVFALLCRALVRHPWAAIVPLVLIATISELVFYTAQAKQYTADTFLVTLALLLGVRMLREPTSRRREVAWYVLLAAGPWFSHGFMLSAPLLAAWVSWCLWRRGSRSPAWLAGRLAVPAASVLAAALWARHLTGQVSDFANYWAAFFAPWDAGWSRLVAWNGWVFRELTLRELGMRYWWALGLVLLGLGAALCRRRTRAAAVLLVLPVLTAYLAAQAGAYPFGRRLILFCVPALLAFVAVLLDTVPLLVARLTRRRWPGVVAGVASAALVLTVAWTQPVRLGNDLRYLYGVDNYRWAFGYVAEHWDAGDVLVIGNGDRAAARVYARRYHIPPDRILRAMPAADTSKRADCPLPRQVASAGQVWTMTGDQVTLYEGATSRFAVAAPLNGRFRYAWSDDRGMVTLQSWLAEPDPAKRKPPLSVRCLDYALLGPAGTPKYPQPLPAN
ncbi:hypothetical protein [Flindersiella endophytica]